MSRSVKVGLGFVVLLGAVIAVRSAGVFDRGERANLSLTLKDMNGKDVRLADLAGKPIIVNFWATWCPPCRLEIPQLVELYEEYKGRGLTILGVSTDDTPELLRPFAEEFHMTYPILVGLDRDDFAQAYGLEGGIPTSVLVKANGRILGRLEGLATKDWWERQIHALF